MRATRRCLSWHFLGTLLERPLLLRSRTAFADPVSSIWSVLPHAQRAADWPASPWGNLNCSESSRQPACPRLYQWLSRNPGGNRPCPECPAAARTVSEFIAYACWAGSTSPPHRLKPLARPCAFLLAARLGRAEVKTTRRLATRHGDGRRLGPRASISQAVRARRNASPLHVSLLGFAMASEASGDGVQNEPLAM